MKGSLFKVVSPLIDLKYNENITEKFKFPSPKRFTQGFFAEFCNPNIVPYFDKDTLVLLYLDSKSFDNSRKWLFGSKAELSLGLFVAYYLVGTLGFDEQDTLYYTPDEELEDVLH